MTRCDKREVISTALIYSEDHDIFKLFSIYQSIPSTICVCLHFGSQRFCSASIGFSIEPHFDDQFIIDLEVNKTIVDDRFRDFIKYALLNDDSFGVLMSKSRLHYNFSIKHVFSRTGCP